MPRADQGKWLKQQIDKMAEERSWSGKSTLDDFPIQAPRRRQTHLTEQNFSVYVTTWSPTMSPKCTWWFCTQQVNIHNEVQAQDLHERREVKRRSCIYGASYMELSLGHQELQESACPQSDLWSMRMCHQLVRNTVSIFMMEDELKGLDGVHQALAWMQEVVSNAEIESSHWEGKEAIGRAMRKRWKNTSGICPWSRQGKQGEWEPLCHGTSIWYRFMEDHKNGTDEGILSRNLQQMPHWTLDQCANRLASGPALVNVKRGMCKWKKEILRSKPCRTTNQGKAGKEIYEEMDKV